ncbi:MAG TPA: TIGR03435 family protein [Bryobacteraceae bacterium]|nr:TIGR03435 family protein [Bryobacteraceae bacterium]
MLTRAVILLACAASVDAPPQAPQPAFEAVSIKPSDKLENQMRYNTPPGRLMASNWTLRDYVRICYDKTDWQVTGGPKWIDENRFDITATLADTPAAAAQDPKQNAELVKAALSELLAERFGLACHRESKAVTGYALTVAKSGPKLEESAPQSQISNRWNDRKLTSTHATMPRLSNILMRIVGSPVVDHTGIEGTYDIVLEWAPDRAKDASDKPDIFAAIQQQLGLRLESQKIEQEILVIDHAELPAAN